MNVTPSPPTRAFGRGLTSSTTILRPMLSHAASCGVDVDSLLHKAGIARAELSDVDVRIPEATRQRLWREAAERCGDEAFGLHATEQAVEGAFDVLDYGLCFSSTLREGLDRTVRFYRILSDALAIEVTTASGRTRVRRLVDGTQRDEQDAYFAVLCLRLRQMSGREIVPHDVAFAHASHAVEAHERYFGCPVRFGCAGSEMTFGADDLAHAVRASKPRLVGVLDRHAAELASRLPSDASYLEFVRRTVVDVIRRGEVPTLEAIAHAMRASPRTLQRRLREAGTTHQRLVDEVRIALATRYLTATELSITEVAYLLGFQDESGFRRSFRRWTGRSPSSVRAEAQRRSRRE
jgi:AraC-like DNA-binding protein